MCKNKGFNYIKNIIIINTVAPKYDSISKETT